MADIYINSCFPFVTLGAKNTMEIILKAVTHYAQTALHFLSIIEVK
jgi:hypothetical protein